MFLYLYLESSAKYFKQRVFYTSNRERHTIMGKNKQKNREGKGKDRENQELQKDKWKLLRTLGIPVVEM